MSGYFTRTLPVERQLGGVATLASVYSAATIAPHGTTTRWTYTCPSNRAAEIEHVQTDWYRDGAAATASLIFCFVLHSAGHTICRNDGSDAVLFSGHPSDASRPGYLVAGESIVGQTQDSSAGGTMRYSVSAGYREFVI